ncbi:sensor histidine kinase [Kineococcus aurantiacus]|uniref:histidine kinase n=1 Tax=Kineococcus aurantiacus TaxID=37633 RepID=A0A7Y9DJR4_9ACTN|nr:HAMP domain-containing sensor histidine kinase [Kineococcus aurantiacus]NYD21478.1 two-component system OmpR family sensor kinase [Kineococcus aurantiacus]
MSRVADRLRAARARALAAEARLPLRVRLLVIVVVLLVLAMSVTSVVSLQLLQRNLRDQVDEELLSKGQAAVETSFANLNQTQSRALWLSDYYVQVADAEGANPIEACERTGSQDCTSRPDLPLLTSAYASARAGRPFTVADDEGGDPWRVLLFQGRIGGSSTVLNFAVALPLSGATRTISDFRSIALLVAAGAILLGGFFAALAIRRSFRPLDDIEQTASAIAAGDLSRRVPGAPAGTEIGRLSTALNAMLTQIESSFRAQQRSEEQMRRFVADASHELRTPLAAIRGFAELYRQGAVREPADVAHVMGRIEGESTRLGRLVEDLLALARLDEAQRARTAAREPVDLAVVASDAVHDARALAPDRAVRLTGLHEGVGPNSAVVLADDAGVRQVLTNLLANAVHHTPAGTPIEVAVGPVQGPSGPESVVEVRDHGPGLTPDQAEKVFERFYRVDSSRRRGTGGGSGLGLAIVATIVDLHGGTVSVLPTEGGGATFRVRFRAGEQPVAVADDPDDDPDDTLDGTPDEDRTGSAGFHS